MLFSHVLGAFFLKRPLWISGTFFPKRPLWVFGAFLEKRPFKGRTTSPPMQVNKRLQRDLQTMMSEEMTSLGIYYIINEADSKKGTGLIFGPEETPYANCPLFFSVQIPADYPFSSPVVLIITSDGETRFHPNLYVGGKVCLSILGTYSGPSWVSTLNIGSVFKSIVSLLDKNPITNEPGWESYAETHPKAKAYAEWVEYRLLKHTLIGNRQFEHGTNELWAKFADVFEEVWPAHLAKIRARVEAKANEPPKEYLSIPYGMSGISKWAELPF